MRVPFKNRRDLAAMDPRVGTLQQQWTALSPSARGHAIARLRPEHSTRVLASLLGCSPKLIRDFSLLAAARPAPGAGPLGRKKHLCLARQAFAVQRRWRRLLSGAQRAGFAAKLEATLERWLRDNVHCACWESFAEQVEDGIWHEEFQRFRPQGFDEIEFEGDWLAVIARYKPDEHAAAFADSLFKYQARWLACWFPRCMPDGGLRRLVFARVTHRLVLEANDKLFRYGGGWRWQTTPEFWSEPPSSGAPEPTVRLTAPTS